MSLANTLRTFALEASIEKVVIVSRVLPQHNYSLADAVRVC